MPVESVNVTVQERGSATSVAYHFVRCLFAIGVTRLRQHASVMGGLTEQEANAYDLGRCSSSGKTCASFVAAMHSERG
jgi:hypothetical protein